MRSKLLVLISCAWLGSACVVGDGGTLEGTDVPTDDDQPPLLSEAGLGNNAHTAFNYFVAKGLTQTQAAGVVGNLMQESSVRPTAVESGGGPGRGIAQWSIGGRWNTLTSFAAARGANRWNLSTQLDFIWHELTTVSAYGLAQLQAATTLTQAVVVFQTKYEICGTCSQSKRIQYAQQALAEYGGSSSTMPASTCYSGTLDRDMPENACVQSMYDGLWYQCAYGQWVDRESNPDPCNGEYPL